VKGIRVDGKEGARGGLEEKTKAQDTSGSERGSLGFMRIGRGRTLSLWESRGTSKRPTPGAGVKEQRGRFRIAQKGSITHINY